jgi:hypothetical protein
MRTPDETRSPSKRFAVGDDPEHSCCWGAQVIDTWSKDYGHQAGGTIAAECANEKTAQLICDLLNAAGAA